MPNKIKLKRSSTTGNSPTAEQIDDGELAINTADKKVFFKDSSGNVQVLNDYNNLVNKPETGSGLLLHPFLLIGS